ncbi:MULTISPECIES: hypothetical protein [unclassified Leifsonia]|uniref:hypothetical protein n=1 Tax=unclassified Leifsonia TaxID=2663824 RepID=UPI0008A80561|nr:MULTISPECIES: hypothetical protein [unclassified Leifsonia]SEI17800.1 hypothetical protein SAMN04515694_1333 [Leifsonia sp. CL154]SFM11441.1 hypothetical protein SAMN04515692_1323 [Leifsonia sp. CL147]
MAGDEIDFDALAARLTDPNVEIGSKKVLRGKEAAAYGRAMLLREYGSEEALAAALIAPGRPKLGSGRRGPSPTVRARISEQDFAELAQLREETGRTEADLVREGVHLLLAQHKRAS